MRPRDAEIEENSAVINQLFDNVRPAIAAAICATLLAFVGLSGAKAANIPQRLLDNHRATMGCWLADIDNDELAERAIVIKFDVQTFFGFICSSSLSGDSYRIYQVEDGRDEWANLVSFPQLDTKLGWHATTQLQKPTWDEKNKLLRSEVPKQGSASTCRQFSIYSWQKGRFHIAQIGLAGDCEEKDSEKDLIIYPFVDEVEAGQAAGGIKNGDAAKEEASDKKK